MITLNRRRCMGGKEKFKLLYEWNSDDDLVNNQWIDRVQGAPFTALNYSGKENGMYLLHYDDTHAIYFNIYLNTATYIVIPFRWKIDIEFYYPSDRNIGRTKDLYLYDFGSVAQSNHNFGFGLNANLDTTANYKPFNNSDNNNYGFTSAIRVEGDKLITLTLGVEAYDSERDIVYTEYNGQKIYGRAPHGHTGYGTGYTRWMLSNGYIGRTNTNSYGAGVYLIKSLKIYEDLR